MLPLAASQFDCWLSYPSFALRLSSLLPNFDILRYVQWKHGTPVAQNLRPPSGSCISTQSKFSAITAPTHTPLLRVYFPTLFCRIGRRLVFLDQPLLTTHHLFFDPLTARARNLLPAAIFTPLGACRRARPLYSLLRSSAAGSFD